MVKNILDTFKRVDLYVDNLNGSGHAMIANVEIIQFDLVGMMTEVPTDEGNEKTEVVFFPWGSVKAIIPIIEAEQTEGGH